LFKTDLREEAGTSNILLIVHYDKAFIDQLSEQLPKIDYRAPMSHFEELKIVAQIYAVTEEKFFNFNLRLDQIIAEGFSLVTSGGLGSGVQGILGASWGELSGFLGLERIKNNIEYVDTIEFYARENNFFGEDGTRYSFNTWFVPVGDVTGSKRQTVGTKVSGFFRLNPENNNYVEFPFLRFIWSKQDDANEFQIPELSMRRQHVQTQIGVPVKLMSINSTQIQKTNNLGLVKVGNAKSYEKKRIVALLTAFKSKEKKTNTKKILTNKEIDNLKESTVEMREIFNKIKLSAIRDATGQTTLRLKCDPRLLSQSNYNHLIKVEIISKEILEEKTHRWNLSDFCLNGKDLYSFNLDRMNKTFYQMKLKFSVVGKKGKNNKKKFKAYYNAESPLNMAFKRL
jgi:hypothetical protein